MYKNIYLNIYLSIKGKGTLMNKSSNGHLLFSNQKVKIPIALFK